VVFFRYSRYSFNRSVVFSRYSFNRSVVFSRYSFQLVSGFLQVLFSTGQWFSPGTLFSSTSKTDCHDITEILMKVALNTIP
jgi:hypothetical protein